MHRYQLCYHEGAGETQSLDVPDIVTALVVADIVGAEGIVEIRDGDAVLARMERQTSAGAPFWLVE